MTFQQTMEKLSENAESMVRQGKEPPGTPSPGSAPAREGDPVKETEGYLALLNKALHYRFDDGGEVKMAFRPGQMIVDGLGDIPVETKKPHISLIDDSLYFISWGGPYGGD